MSTFRIREAIWSDVEQIMSIANKSKELNKVGFLTKDDIDYCINITTKAKFYVASENENHKIIGFVYGFVEVPSTACLMYICVDEKWRGKGVGTTLVNDFMTDIRKYGVSKIYCLTTTEKSSVFFNKVGFDYTGNLLGYMEIA